MRILSLTQSEAVCPQLRLLWKHPLTHTLPSTTILVSHSPPQLFALCPFSSNLSSTDSLWLELLGLLPPFTIPSPAPDTKCSSWQCRQVIVA